MSHAQQSGLQPRGGPTLRVLLAHNRYRVRGGEERHIELLARQLSRMGHEVRRLEMSSESIQGFGRVTAAMRMTFSLTGARAVSRLLAEFPADVVHFHNITPLLTPAALWAAKQHGARVVLTAHNYRLVCPGGTMARHGRTHDDCVRSSLLCGLRGARNSKIESVLYAISIELQRRLRLVERWVDAIVTPSRAVADVLVRGGYDARKIHVVAYGVEMPAERPRRSEFALYTGRLSEEKGIRTLLRAATASRVPVVIAGDGPLAESVRDQSGNGIRFLGMLSPVDLESLRARAAYIVAPSEWPEVLPFAVLEALAQGVPVIASEVGGVIEIARHGGVQLVPHGDEMALAKAMVGLWSDEDMRGALGREARASAGAHYSLERQTRAVLEIYTGERPA